MSEDTRDRILAACARVISRRGLAKFRMSDVAREAGVSIGLLPYHFGDRDSLLAAALDEVTAAATRRAAAQPLATTPGARLAALLCSEFGDEPGIREGSTAWNELRAAAVFDTTRAAAVTHSTADWEAAVRGLVSEALDPAARGDASPAGLHVDPQATALLLTALVEGLSGRWLTGQLTTEEAQRSVLTTLRTLGISPDGISHTSGI